MGQLRFSEAGDLLQELRIRAQAAVPDIPSLAITISHIPYGRTREPTPECVVDAWRGTCSTKHLLLQRVVPALDPDATVRLVHRIYRVDRDDAAERWGGDVATAVPADGLVDVHTYAQVDRHRSTLAVDVTFPIVAWDGKAPLPLACGDGEDHPAGDDPIASKAALTQRWCDPSVREPFIAALARAYGTAG